MNRPFRFAIQTGPFDDPDALAVFANKIETLGYDGLYSYDHVGLRGSAAVDPFLPLVVAARATSRLLVGPLVLNNEFHHPALLARTALSADQMTAGRLVLGLGTGYSQEEHDAIGLKLRAPGPRVSRFEESLVVLRQLIDTGSCRFDGEFHHIDVETIGLRPVQPRVPFLIGGHGRRVVALAGQHADIFQFTGLTHAEDGTPSGGGFAIEQIDERAAWLEEAAGDRNDRIERSALVQLTGVGDNAPTAADLADRFKLDADTITESPFVLCGSAEQVIDKIERLRERLGITHFVVRDPEDFAPIVAALT